MPQKLFLLKLFLLIYATKVVSVKVISVDICHKSYFCDNAKVVVLLLFLTAVSKYANSILCKV